MKLTALLFSICLAVFANDSKAQYYYPPTSGDWDTLSPDSLNWCPQKIQNLYDYLQSTNSKAFIVLKDGKIVLEKYFGSFTADSIHQWNSAGKTLTGFMTGIAQQEGFLNISDTVSTYLGTGWTSLTAAQEEKIQIKHQISMTTGLDDGNSFDCTSPSCLTYLTTPGTRWAYHNAPYTLVQDVIGSAVGQSLNLYVNAKLTGPTGISGLFVPIGDNKVFFSKPRSMARFGLLMLSQGNWNGNAILNDPTYYNEMVNSSNSMNPSYGYLTWLNGKSNYIVPSTQFSVNQSLVTNAPADMYAALGKNDQILNIVPSQDLVIVRMGDGGGTLVGNIYNDSLWIRINDLTCNLSLTESDLSNKLNAYPNPNNGSFEIQELAPTDQIECYNALGKSIEFARIGNSIKLQEAGIYFLTITRNDISTTKRISVQ